MLTGTADNSQEDWVLASNGTRRVIAASEMLAYLMTVTRTNKIKASC